MPTPIEEEANDDDHKTSDQVTTESCWSTRTRSAQEWYGNPVWNSCYQTKANL